MWLKRYNILYEDVMVNLQWTNQSGSENQQLFSALMGYDNADTATCEQDDTEIPVQGNVTLITNTTCF